LHTLPPEAIKIVEGWWLIVYSILSMVDSPMLFP
jgi:hypothetical protein